MTNSLASRKSDSMAGYSEIQSKDESSRPVQSMNQGARKSKETQKKISQIQSSRLVLLSPSVKEFSGQ